MKTLEQYRAERLSESEGGHEDTAKIRDHMANFAKKRWDYMYAYLTGPSFDASKPGDRANAAEHVNDMIRACNMVLAKLGQSPMR